MKHEYKKWIKYIAVGSSFALVLSTLGVGCGVAFQGIGWDFVDQSSHLTPIGQLEDNDDLTIVAGQKTVATVYHTQVLDNMQSVSGVQNLSDDTRTALEEKLGSFSEYGSVLSVNAPMLLGFTTLGSEICADLLAEEAAVAAASRRIFTQVNFGQQPVSDAAVDDMVRRLARSFWQRNETAAELAIIKTAITETLALANDNNNNVTFRGFTSRRGALRATLLTCAAMISSTDAIQI